MKYGEKIAAKIEELVKEKGVKRTKLGEILGAPKNVTAQRKYSKFNNFLNSVRKSKIDFQDLKKIADFLDKELEWFLAQESAGAFSINKNKTRLVPFLGPVKSIKNNSWSEKDVLDWLVYPVDAEGSDKIFALEVQSDCMTPNICKKDIIFVDPQFEGTCNNKIIVAFVKNYSEPILRRMLVRQDGTIELKCDNITCSSIIINPQENDMQIAGLVRQKLAKI